MKNKIVIFTGAGISTESGIETFRDSDGLWENHKVEDVANIQAWDKNKELMLNFYNARRAQLKTVEPNEAHKQLVRLEEKYDVYVITQNVDNLHERAGSKKVLHLHGELTKAKSSSGKPGTSRHIGYEDIKIGDLCEDGFQMRPDIVWFGELVPMIHTAQVLAYDSDIFIVIGTSLVVYPAAGILGVTKSETPIYVVNPNGVPLQGRKKYTTFIKEVATKGTKELVDKLMA